MDKHLICGAIILIALFLSKMLSEKALRKLSQDQKAELIDLFSKQRIYSIFIMTLLLISFYVAIVSSFMDHAIAYTIFYSMVLLFVVTSSIISYIKLKNNNFPFTYIKSHLLSTTISIASILAFCSMTLFS